MASLVVVLPADPVTAMSGFPHRRRTAAASLLQCEKRILHRQQLILPREPRELVLGNDSTDRAFGERRLDKIMSVQPLAANRKEQIAGQQGARIDGIAAGDRVRSKFAGGLHEFGGARQA